jgi:wyosine [tRNA(Phe)-imidazoG37] synthetase (radical SAM superfamily)
MGRVGNLYANLSKTVIYGPVSSRRLGKSLGINLFPSATEKICTFNCIYCYFKVESKLPPSSGLKKPSDIIAELQSYSSDPVNLSDFLSSTYLTLSGNGEPTLHPEFPEIVSQLVKWRDENYKEKQIAIFTNGTGLFNQAIYKSLMRLDRVFIKLDVGSQPELETLCRPLIEYSFDDLKKKIKSFIDEATEVAPKCEVVIQSAIFCPENRSATLDTAAWSSTVRYINPPCIHIYELDFAGKSYKSDELYDYLAFEARIRELLKDLRTSIKFYIETRKFYITVYLCYAVDSILYLPLYIGLLENLFQQHNVKIEHFESTEGDLGAYKALKSGRAQFALCDPSIVFADDDYFSKSGRLSILLASLIINKIGLWCLGGANMEKIGDIAGTDNVISYVEESTANIILKWQKAFWSDKKGPSTGPVIKSVQAGEEFKWACPNNKHDPLESAPIVTADPLGAIVCESCGGSAGRRLYSYSQLKMANPYVFTGLLVDSNFMSKYPGAVKDVVSGFNEAIKLLYDDAFYEQNKIKIRNYLEGLFIRKSPWYLRSCSKTISSKVAIHDTLDLVRKEELYSKSGNPSMSAVYNAIKIRNAGSSHKVSLGKLVTYMAHNMPEKRFNLSIMGFIIKWPFLKQKEWEWYYSLLACIVLCTLTIVTGIYAYVSQGSIRWISLGVTAILAGITGTVIVNFIKGTLMKRSILK